MKSMLYLRTDLGAHDLMSGGSVAHTLGVIDALAAQSTTIYCASSAMHRLLAKRAKYTQESTVIFKPLLMPKGFRFLGFKLSCIISNMWFLVSVFFFIRGRSITHIYQRYSMLNIVGILIALYKRVPLVLEFNGSETWVDAYWSPRKKISANWLVALFEKWNVQHADYIIVVSQVLKDMLVARGVKAHKILVNPNGVDIEQFNPEYYEDKRVSLRSVYDLQDRYVFGFIGSFSYWHGIDIISQMIPKIIALQPRAHFVLIGSGPLQEQMQKDIRYAGVTHAVTFIGNVPCNQAPEYLSMCDAYVCPSQPNQDGTPFFGSPTKLFEYMSMAKPIIASDVDQLRDIIDPSYGYLIRPDDVDGFVRVACSLMAKDATVQKIMGDYARQKAIESFSWQQHVQRIKQFVA